jgi:hypothetical protein
MDLSLVVLYTRLIPDRVRGILRNVPHLSGAGRFYAAMDNESPA